METIQIALKLFLYMCMTLHVLKKRTLYILQTYIVWNGEKKGRGFEQELGIIGSEVIRNNTEQRHTSAL